MAWQDDLGEREISQYGAEHGRRQNNIAHCAAKLRLRSREREERQQQRADRSGDRNAAAVLAPYASRALA